MEKKRFVKRFLSLLLIAALVTCTVSGCKASGSEVPVETEPVITEPVPAGYVIPAQTLKVANLGIWNEQVVQVVNTVLTDEGFSPAVVAVRSDLPVYWNIDNQLTSGDTELLAARYSARYPLTAGVNRLLLTPDESFDISTGDNQFYGYVKVVENLVTVNKNAVLEEASAFETMIYPAAYFETEFDITALVLREDPAEALMNGATAGASQSRPLGDDGEYTEGDGCCSN